MTVLTVGVVTAIATAGAATVVTAPALTGITAGIVEGAVTVGSAGATVAVSAAAGAVTGAISGACANATGSAVVGSAAIGSASAAAVTSATVGVASGLIGCVVLGAEDTQYPIAGATFDCWKPVVRDDSTQLSSGKLLKEILEDQRIKEIIPGESRNSWNLPELSLVNIWDEQFDINYLVLPYNNQLVAHAVRVA
jgi:hypothetical protein